MSVSAFSCHAHFPASQDVFVRSAMIYKNHGKTDEETAAMLKKDFMLNEQQTLLILDEIKGRV